MVTVVATVMVTAVVAEPVGMSASQRGGDADRGPHQGTGDEHPGEPTEFPAALKPLGPQRPPALSKRSIHTPFFGAMASRRDKHTRRHRPFVQQKSLLSFICPENGAGPWAR
jgi:hypothetical protein